MFNQLFRNPINPIKYPDLVENKIRTYLQFQEVGQLDQVYQAMINGQDLILLDEGDNLKYIPSSVFWKDGEKPSILYKAYHLHP